MNYWKVSAILLIFLFLGLPGTASAADLSVQGSILPAAPVAAFHASPTTGFRPLSVTFTDDSTGTISTWKWEYNSGSGWTEFGSGAQNPVYSFATAGTYDIRLTATNTGGSDDETKLGYITVNPNVDFTISGLVNCVPATAIFAKETNTVTVATIKNQGTDAASNIVVKVYASDVDSGNTAIITTTIASLGAGASTSLTLIDPTIRNLAGGTVTYTAKVDPDNLIAETNEANNNKASTAKPLVYNGYKGKRYWEGGSDITTKKTYDLNGDIVYYTQPDSAYKGVGWTTRTETWSAANLPIPAGATVEKAWLYFSYNWDQTPGGYPILVTTFNGNAITLGTPYRDWSNFGTYADYEYGLYPAYDVTSMFNVNGDNTLVTNPGDGGADNQVALYPSTLVVVYSDPSKTRKQIFMNEEFDYLAVSQSTYGTTMAEATAYAPFTGMTIDTGSVQGAHWYGFATNAGPAEGNVFFNGNSLGTNVFTGTTMTADAKVFDVKNYLTATGNEAAIQGTESGGMGAIQQFLVVEYTAAAPTAAFTWTPTSPDKGTSVSFDGSTSTGIISSYTWDFGDGGSGSGASASHTYTTAGDKTVRLTVTGPGGTNYVEHTVHVKEPAPVVDFTGTPTSGTSPLTVAFAATNTGGSVTSYGWDFGDGTTGSGQTVSHTYTTATAQTYTVTLTATGPDYTVTKTRNNYIQVGAATIDVSVAPASINFGTMTAGIDSTGSSTVSVDVTGGTPWSIAAAANNGGFMKAGSTPLASAIQLSNGGAYQYMNLGDFTSFLTGSAGGDGSGPANVKQAIGSGDQPGAYTITLTFTGAFN
jgi:PKD repeat protein